MKTDAYGKKMDPLLDLKEALVHDMCKPTLSISWSRRTRYRARLLGNGVDIDEREATLTDAISAAVARMRKKTLANLGGKA